MINAEELLKPVADGKPCGEDLTYDQSFLELETMMRGKPETQFSPAEDPNWKEVKDRCLELWKKSKDLRIATALAVAELKTDGIPGFRECLALLNGLVTTHWTDLYPQLDPADGNDPTQRVNIIASLAAPIGTFGDPMKILELLREAPLTNSARMGRFGAAAILRSQAGTPGPDGQSPPSQSQIEAAFRDTSPEELQSLAQKLAEAADLVGQVDENLTKAVGATKAADLSPLKNEIKGIQKILAQYVAGAGPATEAAGEAAVETEPGTGAGAAKPISGEVQSRQDVIRMLEKICQYYARREPSSPVPYLLKRAQRLAEKNFMEIISDLSPDALEQIARITGQEKREGEGEAPPSEPSPST
jgi:type VI secretion system protein ImpA